MSWILWTLLGWTLHGAVLGVAYLWWLLRIDRDQVTLKSQMDTVYELVAHREFAVRCHEEGSNEARPVDMVVPWKRWRGDFKRAKRFIRGHHRYFGCQSAAIERRYPEDEAY